MLSLDSSWISGWRCPVPVPVPSAPPFWQKKPGISRTRCSIERAVAAVVVAVREIFTDSHVLVQI